MAQRALDMLAGVYVQVDTLLRQSFSSCGRQVCMGLPNTSQFVWCVYCVTERLGVHCDTNPERV